MNNRIVVVTTLLTALSLTGCASKMPMPDTTPSHQPGYNATECARLDREMANGTPGHDHTTHEIACGLPPDSMKDNMSENMSTTSPNNMTMSDNTTNTTNSTNMSSMG